MTTQRIGQFAIVAELAQTAEGAVYKATDPKGRTVALRTLRLDGTAAETAARFRAAAQAASALRSPNIASIFGGGEAGGVFFISVEFVEGVKLSSNLAKGEAASMSEVLDLSRQVCYALDHAQSKGIVHPELKPSNIIVEWDGTAKIMDFGVPRQHPAGEISEASYYLSPEEARGEPLTPRSNLFSWAAILYEMATGKKAFDAPDAAGLQRKIMEEMPAPAHQVNGKLPARLSEVLMKALAKSPAERYASGAELLAALEDSRKAESAPPRAVAPALKPARPAPGPAAAAAAPTAARAPLAATGPGAASAAAPAKAAAPAPPPPAKTTPAAPPAAAAAEPRATAERRSVASGPPATPKAAASGRPNLLLYGMGAAILVLVGAVVVLWMRSTPANPAPRTTSTAAATTTSAAPTAAPTTAATPAAQPGGGTPRNRRKEQAAAPVPAAPVTGELRVESVPSGAEVQIDGRHEGSWTTPFTASGLTAGAHTITVTKSGYATVNRAAEVTAGQSQGIAVQLSELAATIAVNSEPAGAAISLDGKETGKVTPAQIVVAKGSHTIAVHKAGYLDASSVLETAPGQSAQFSPALKQTGSTDNIKTVGKLGGIFGNAPENSGRVSVRTNPKGAQVTVNGQPLKKVAPVDFYLTPGSYQISLSLDGYKPVSKIVDVQKGGKLVVDETLTH